MRRLTAALAMMACALLSATAGAVTFTSDATVSNKDYGTEQVVVIGPAHVTFDNVHWGAFNANGATYEGRLSVIRGGVVNVKNSKLGPGGCSDGIQASGGGGAWGVVNVSNTEFTGMMQGSCGPHVDPIQLYGGILTATDNYFHDNSTGIMSPDCNGTMTVKNNVFVGTGYHQSVIAGSNATITHNVTVGWFLGADPGGCSSVVRNTVLRDNAGDTRLRGGDSSSSLDHNDDVTFTGGAGRCGYATKAPKGTASDGTDIGLNDCATGPPPPPSDRDGDGVPDASDKCPDQPGTGPDGCPPQPPPPTLCDQACEDAYKATIADLKAKLAAKVDELVKLQALANAYKARAEKAETTVAHVHEETAP